MGDNVAAILLGGKTHAHYIRPRGGKRPFSLKTSRLHESYYASEQGTPTVRNYIKDVKVIFANMCQVAIRVSQSDTVKCSIAPSALQCSS